MKRLQFIKPTSGEKSGPTPIETLLDPIRSKILFEIILKSEVTAEKLMKVTQKSRSTISHHLKKLVESGIIEVYMNPTGKIKYYQLNKGFMDRSYTLDKEALVKSSIEDSSAFIIEFYNMIAIMSHIYSNLFTEQIKLLQKKVPFEKIGLDKDNEIIFYVDGEKRKIPETISFITGKKEADFLAKGLDKLMDEYKQEFGEAPESFMNLESKPMYLFNVHLFPYYEDKE